MDRNIKETSMSDLLEMGARAAKVGNKEVARAIYLQVLERDRRNEQALLALAGLADDIRQRKHYLQLVLKHNPEHVKAGRYLERLEESEREHALLEDKLIGYGLIAAMIGIVLMIMVIGAVLLIR